MSIIQKAKDLAAEHQLTQQGEKLETKLRNAPLVYRPGEKC